MIFRRLGEHAREKLLEVAREKPGNVKKLGQSFKMMVLYMSPSLVSAPLTP